MPTDIPRDDHVQEVRDDEILETKDAGKQQPTVDEAGITELTTFKGMDRTVKGIRIVVVEGPACQGDEPGTGLALCLGEPDDPVFKELKLNSDEAEIAKELFNEAEELVPSKDCPQRLSFVYCRYEQLLQKKKEARAREKFLEQKRDAIQRVMPNKSYKKETRTEHGSVRLEWQDSANHGGAYVFSFLDNLTDLVHGGGVIFSVTLTDQFELAQKLYAHGVQKVQKGEDMLIVIDALLTMRQQACPDWHEED